MKNKALFLAIAIALTLSACSGKSITTDQNTDSEAGYKQAYKEIIETDCEKKASLTEEHSIFDIAHVPYI